MESRATHDGTMHSDGTNMLRFFDDIARLMNEIGRTMCVALDQGHAAVCVVTPATRDLLEKQLRDRGIDVEAMRRAGQYVCLDAALAIGEIVPEGKGPDADRFAVTIGALVDRLAKTYAGVWMYGELAGVLWLTGDQTGAVQLDRMWTSFADTHPVCLSIAFPMDALSHPVIADAIHKTVADQIRTLAKNSPLALAVRRGPYAGD